MHFLAGHPKLTDRNLFEIIELLHFAKWSFCKRFFKQKQNLLTKSYISPTRQFLITPIKNSSLYLTTSFHRCYPYLHQAIIPRQPYPLNTIIIREKRVCNGRARTVNDAAVAVGAEWASELSSQTLTRVHVSVVAETLLMWARASRRRPHPRSSIDGRPRVRERVVEQVPGMVTKTTKKRESLIKRIKLTQEFKCVFKFKSNFPFLKFDWFTVKSSCLSVPMREWVPSCVSSLPKTGKFNSISCPWRKKTPPCKMFYNFRFFKFKLNSLDCLMLKSIHLYGHH